MNRRQAIGLMAAAIAARQAPAQAEWISLFDGHSLDGWRPSENKNSWNVVEGALTANGPRSHLFYVGPVRGADFRNFELEVELTTQPDCNSGVYFHTAYQESGFPEKGFEVQVNNTALGDGGYLERKKTGSLYGIRNMYKQLVPDEKPFRMSIAVRGKNVRIRLNQELVVDYVEPTPAVIPQGGEKLRFLDHGTFALQCHNNGSRVRFTSVRVRLLDDHLPDYVDPAPVVDDVYRSIINIGRHNVPMVDYRVFLQAGMTLEELLKKSRADGIQCGVVELTSRLKGDAAAREWLAGFAGRPVFCGLCADDPKWVHTISHETVRQFDYVVADDRAWVDRQKNMDGLAERVVQRLNSEPLDIYAMPGYLPADGEVVTDLIEALVKNQVAVELTTRGELPSRAFIERAKAAGCKFAFGTGNRTAAELKRCEYGLAMVETCKLDWKNFFVPGSWWPKAADRQRSAA